MIIKFTLGPEATTPTRSYKGDAGWDLYSVKSLRIEPYESVNVETDVYIALPDGFFGRITARSSTISKHGLLIVEGIIDNGWRGPLTIRAFNPFKQSVWIQEKTRLAQLLIHRIHEVRWELVKELPPSERGKKGFGSSGQ